MTWKFTLGELSQSSQPAFDLSAYWMQFIRYAVFLTIVPAQKNLKENVSLAPLTTLKIGGPARFFVKAENEMDVSEAFDFASKMDVPVFVLGGGSNVVISDAGFEGLVVQPAILGIKEAADGELVSVSAGAGENWDKLVARCVSRGLAGFECLSGIPGLVGGTPVQNVGAYGQEVSETITTVRCFDRSSNEFIELSNAECEFAYRRSIFNTIHQDRFVVLSVTYALHPSGEPKIVYKDLVEYFEGTTPTPGEVREAVLKIRASKSMVIDEADPNSKSVGSFFKNPIVPVEKYNEIAEGSERIVPSFPAGNGRVKIPAAWLVEQSGFKKGFALGNAAISSNHTLAIINRGGASAADVLHLKNVIQEGVRKRFDITLEPEPVFVGF